MCSSDLTLRKFLAKLIGPAHRPGAKLIYIDMQPKANQKLTEALHGPEGLDLKELPRGEQELGGVKFRIVDALMQLGSRRMSKRPQRFEGIRVGTTFTRLHILHGTGFADRGIEEGTEIGRYVVRYEDRTEEQIPIVYGENVRDWWRNNDLRPVSCAEVAWIGRNAFTRRISKAVMVRLYSANWDNLHPDKKVVSIDYISAMTAAAPFCVAMTVEQAPKDKEAPKPGGRPDASKEGAARGHGP